MAGRRFRWWHKKRGGRRTGSKLLGSLGEAIFFAALFVFGAVSLTALVVSQFVSPIDPESLDAASQTPSLAVGTMSTPGEVAASVVADEGRRLLRVVASYRYGFGFWLMTLVLSSFVIMGGSGLTYTLLHLGTSEERRAALAKRAADIDLISEAIPSDKAYPTLPSDSDLTNSPGTHFTFRLPTVESPAWQFAAATLFGLLWNSLAVGLLVVAVKSHVQGRPDWLLTLLVLPFAAVGAWSIRYFSRQVVWMTAVGPTIVEIADHPLRPGMRTQVYLSQSGHRRLKRFEVDLVCEEETHYHQGTDIRTEICLVYRREVWREKSPSGEVGESLERVAEIQVPAEAMHSFQWSYNRVRWRLVARIEVEGLPLCERSFPVLVYPPALVVQRPQAVRSPTGDAARPVGA